MGYDGNVDRYLRPYRAFANNVGQGNSSHSCIFSAEKMYDVDRKKINVAAPVNNFKVRLFPCSTLLFFSRRIFQKHQISV